MTNESSKADQSDDLEPRIPMRAFVLYGAAIPVFAAGWLRASRDTVDDAYITFRCVENFVNGLGIGFNPGMREEAYSNALMAGLLVPFSAVGFPLEIAATLLGIISFVLSVWLVGRLAGYLGASEVTVTAARAAMLGSFPFLYYSITGLETGLLGMLLLAAVVRWYVAGRCIETIGGLLWLAVALSRPEAPAYLIALLPTVLLSGKDTVRRSLAGLTIVLLGFVAFIGWRIAYFGAPFPNPYYSKAAGTADLDPRNHPAWAIFTYLMDFVFRSGLLLPVLAFYGAVRGAFVGLTPALDRLGILPVAGMLGTGTAFAMYAGGDWFPAGRYLLPILPFMIVLALLVGEQMWKVLRPNAAPLIGAVICVATFLVGSIYTLAEFIRKADTMPFHVMNGQDCARAGLWIRDNTPPDFKVVTYRIGAVGYYSQREVIDLFGLADKEIGRIVGAHPIYHPANLLGSDIPELQEIILRRDPHSILVVEKKDGLRVPPLFQHYDRWYTQVRRFPQGADQEWLLYVDNRRLYGANSQPAQNTENPSGP